jgi:hypothetical protein
MRCVASILHTTSEHDVSSITTIARLLLKCDGTRAETRFRLSAKRTCPFKSAGASLQSTAGSRGVRISCSNAGYTAFRGSVKSTGCPLRSPVPLHFPFCASPCAIKFHLDSTFRMCDPCSLIHQIYGLLVRWLPIDPQQHSVV